MAKEMNFFEKQDLQEKRKALIGFILGAVFIAIFAYICWKCYSSLGGIWQILGTAVFGIATLKAGFKTLANVMMLLTIYGIDFYFKYKDWRKNKCA